MITNCAWKLRRVAKVEKMSVEPVVPNSNNEKQHHFQLALYTIKYAILQNMNIIYNGKSILIVI